MKVLLVNPNSTGQSFIPLGMAYLSSYLKRAGHKISVFDTHFSVKENAKKDFGKRLQSFKPELIGISCREPDFEEALPLARLAKKAGKTVVWGGTYPTVAPEEAINTEGVDIVCIGEAEQAFVELLEKLEKKKSYFKTKNFWFKKQNGTIVKNDIRCLDSDLSKLPMPDWDSFLKESKNFDVTFMSSRGCPFQCAYCVNHVYQKIYKGKGPYVRMRGPDSLIKEVKHAVKKYGLQKVIFVDDAFTVGKARIRQFAKKYKKEVGLPLWAITRADMVDKETFKLLREAGLESVSMGVESGSDFIRASVLKRQMSKETIIKAFKTLKELGIHTHSFNILGAPCETKETIWETINLNRKLDPSGVQFSILTPYKGTELRESVEKQGLLLKGNAGDFYTESMIMNENLSIAELEAWQKTAWLYVFSPKLAFPFIHASRKALQYSPAAIRRKLGQAFVLSAMVFGVYKRTGFTSTAKMVAKRLVGG